MTINDLHKLDNEIRELQENYSKAINYIAALRIDKANLLQAINNSSKLEIVKELYISDNFEQQIEELYSREFLFKDLKLFNSVNETC